MAMWVCGGLIWVPGDRPAETILDVAGLDEVVPVGYRTREDITSRSFATQTALRAVFREAGFTFLVEPEYIRNGSFATLEPLSEAFGRAWGIAIDETTGVCTAGAATKGKITGSVYAEGDTKSVNRSVPNLDLEAPSAARIVLSLLERSVGKTLHQLVFEGTREQANSTDDPWMAAVLNHECIAEVFSVNPLVSDLQAGHSEEE